MGVRVGVANLFLGQSIDIDGLWALEWAWHAAETNLRCVRSSGICMPNSMEMRILGQLAY